MDNVTTVMAARSAYLAQRPLMGLVSHSAPIFLVLGNHEQEEGWHRDDTGNLATSKPILGANARKRYFLNPVPNAFYSGNDDVWPALTGDGLPGDYYAWRWGDALFVAIDPYWYTTTKPFLGNTGGGESSDTGSGDRWDWTLGIEQYQWLKQTLEASDARFKFIFAHHGTGGTDDYIRGGANGAPFSEWGGHNEDGTTWAFDERRPGWHAPVHQLLVDTHVTAFFHGHDHAFAYEERDGVVYQLVPMAADRSYGFGFQNYRESDPYTIRVLPNSGHVRVTVSASTATVDYVRAFLPGEGNNAEVAYSYTMTSWTGGDPGVTSIQASPQGGSGPVSVSWNGIAAPSPWDWLGLYAPGTPDTAYLGWIYTTCSNTPAAGGTSGSCSFEVPSTVPPGTYEMRLFANATYSLLARSAPFTLTMTAGPALMVTPTMIERGGSVTATWSGIEAPTPTDWLGIYAAGTDDEAFIDWIYTSCSKTTGAGDASGACAFVVPWHVAPGAYELRLFANGQYYRIATSNTLAVSLVGEPNLTVDPVVYRGNPVTVSWRGIPTPTTTDWVGLYAPGTPDDGLFDWNYLSCSKVAGAPASSGACPFVVPSWVPAGTYEMRLFANAANAHYARMAVSAPFTVMAPGEVVVTANPATINAGAPVTVSWAGIGSPTPNDWLGIYVPGAAHDAYLDWMYVSCTQQPGQSASSGSCPFVVPAWLGDGVYEIRVFSSGGSGLYYWLATTPPLVVGSGLEAMVSSRSDP